MTAEEPQKGACVGGPLDGMPVALGEYGGVIMAFMHHAGPDRGEYRIAKRDGKWAYYWYQSS